MNRKVLLEILFNLPKKEKIIRLGPSCILFRMNMIGKIIFLLVVAILMALILIGRMRLRRRPMMVVRWIIRGRMMRILFLDRILMMVFVLVLERCILIYMRNPLGILVYLSMFLRNMILIVIRWNRVERKKKNEGRCRTRFRKKNRK